MVPEGYTIYGYQTGNGGHGIPILAKNGIPELTANNHGPVRYFRFPDEPPMTYRLWDSPAWVVLPFGTIPTPDSYPNAIAVQGQIGIYINKVPHPMLNFVIPEVVIPTAPEVILPGEKSKEYPKAIPIDLVQDEPIKKPRRRKKDPLLVELERRQLEHATTRFDITGANTKPRRKKQSAFVETKNED